MTHIRKALSTPRLKLKPPQQAHAEKLFSISADKSITQYLAWEPHSSLGESLKVIQSMIDTQSSGRALHWLIWENDNLIGVVSLIDVKLKQRSWLINRAELSYWISSPHKGRGYATEAAYSVIQYAFDELKLKKIIVAHADENIASKRVIEKLGFNRYATERFAFKKSCTWHSLIWYDLLDNEFSGKSGKN